MTFTVAWGLDESLPDRQPRVEVSSSVELDTVLDRIESEEEDPTSVDIFRTGHGKNGTFIQIGVGHPDHSFVVFLDAKDADPDLSATGKEPGHVPPSEPIGFDFGGEFVYCGNDRAMVSPKVTREAAHEFIRTGERPTSLEWLQS